MSHTHTQHEPSHSRLDLLSQSWVALSGVVLIVAACVQFYFLASEADGNITQEQGGKLLLGCVETTLGLWAVSGLWPVRATQLA